jgi:biopolymer transport protein ExbD
MRRRHTASENDDSVIDLTPMLDVVFIMLIFFIVTASFVKESGIEVNRPHAQTAVKAIRGNILIGISAENQIWVQNRIIDLRAVRANIERLHAENPQGAVIVQADEGSRTGVLVAVMDQVRLAGVENVSIAADAEP